MSRMDISRDVRRQSAGDGEEVEEGGRHGNGKPVAID